MLGPTGKFPQGKVDLTDEGELTLGVAWDPEARIVRIAFGKPITWLGLYPDQAIEFAKMILEKAERGKQ